MSLSNDALVRAAQLSDDGKGTFVILRTSNWSSQVTLAMQTRVIIWNNCRLGEAIFGLSGWPGEHQHKPSLCDSSWFDVYQTTAAGCWEPMFASFIQRLLMSLVNNRTGFLAGAL